MIGSEDPVNVATPRSVDDALAWQLERVGSTAWEGWAWKFQRLAFGFLRDGGWATTGEALDWFTESGALHDGSAPRGALVWYATAAGPGVCCALGDGTVVGPGLPDAVRIAAEQDLPGRYGWTEAAFPYAR